jgi:hypothetical protein
MRASVGDRPKLWLIKILNQSLLESQESLPATGQGYEQLSSRLYHFKASLTTILPAWVVPILTNDF